MLPLCLVVFALLLPCALPSRVKAQGDVRSIWVFLKDKKDDESRIAWHLLERPDGSPEPDDWVEPSPRQLDLPLDERYVRHIAAIAESVRCRSRWLNAVSVEINGAGERALAELPFVLGTRRVKSLQGPVPPPAQSVQLGAAKPADTIQLDYGPSFDQVSRIGVTHLHGQDIRGQGVRIGLLDSGFNYSDHAAFAHLQVLAERDFINDDDAVGDEESEPVTGNERQNNQNEHGTQVLSVLAGFAPGELVGIAPEAQYLLAKTEEPLRELSADEDRWVAGLEWLTAEGAQVVNSSVGFTVFDDSKVYTIDDLDGGTSLATIAAELAVKRGVIVVVSAGNEGQDVWRYVSVPADGPGVIAVGAVSLSNSAIAAFSSRGPTADGRIKPDVVAPGQGVIATSGRGVADGSSEQGTFGLREYVRVSGTSFAAPLATGVCALIRQVHPDWDPDQVAKMLRSTARDLGVAGPDNVYGWGLVDAVAASGLDIAAPASPFPNPLVLGGVNGANTIYFPLMLSDRGAVSVHIYDLSGTLVDVVEEVELEPGSYLCREDGALLMDGIRCRSALQWKPAEMLAAGMYYYRIEAHTACKLGQIAIIRQ